MPDIRDLEKQLKASVKTGKYVVGRREVLRSLKGSKILVWSASSNLPPKMLDQSKSLGVPAIRFEGNPVQLGRACGIPFRVSVIAVKTPGDADLSAFLNSSDYAPRSGFKVTEFQYKSEPEAVQKIVKDVAHDQENLEGHVESERPAQKIEKNKRKKEVQVKEEKSQIEVREESKVSEKEERSSKNTKKGKQREK